MFFPVISLALCLSLLNLLTSLSSVAKNWQNQIIWQNIESLKNDGQNQEALLLFNQNNQLKTNLSASQSLLLGKIYWQEKDLAKAFYYLEKAKDIDSNLTEADYLYFLLNLSLNPQKAAVPIEDAPLGLRTEIESFSASTNQLNKELLADKILILVNQPYLAKNLTNRIVEQNPQYPVAYLYQGIIEARLGNQSMAKKEWWKAINLDPNNQDLIATIINLNGQSDAFSRVLGKRINRLEKTKN